MRKHKKISLEERLCKLDGFLKEYADSNNTDSVELIHEAIDDLMYDPD